MNITRVPASTSSKHQNVTKKLYENDYKILHTTNLPNKPGQQTEQACTIKSSLLQLSPSTSLPQI